MNDADSVIKSLSAENRQLRERLALAGNRLAEAQERFADIWEEGYTAGVQYTDSVWIQDVEGVDTYMPEPENPYVG